MLKKGIAKITRRKSGKKAKATFDAIFTNYRNTLSYLVAQYFDINKRLVRAKNRTAAMNKKTEIGAIPRALESEWIETLEDKKQRTMAAIKVELKKMDDWKWMKKFPGLGPVGAATLLSKIDIDRLENPSAFWKVTIGSIVNNRVSPPIKGHRYFPKIKTAMCFYTGQLTLLRLSPWRELFDKYKKAYRKAHPKEILVGGKKFYSKGHIHNMARRKMVERWMIGLWQRWRIAHGFNTSLAATAPAR